MIKNAGAWTPPEKELRLYSGAKIVTRQGTAMVLFDDGATMQVDAFSSIRAMDQMQKKSAGDGQAVLTRSIRIMLGRTKYEEQPLQGRKTRIELPTAVAALRGTGGWFGAAETGESLGSLYEGNMDTSGQFQELIPRILELAQALSSPTWQASMASVAASDDAVLNVRDIQSEVNTFLSNSDAAVTQSVQSTLLRVSSVLNGIETKYAGIEQARQIKQTATSRLENVTDTMPPAVINANTVSAQVTDAFIDATEESLKTDIILILETLKGDPAGMATARQAKEQNDRALDIAQNAVIVAGDAAAFAATATSDTQRNTAMTIARASSNTVDLAMSTISISSASVWLAARDDIDGSAHAETLMGQAGETLETTDNTVKTLNEALENSKASTTEAEAEVAQTLARTGEADSETTKAAVETSFQEIQELVPADATGTDGEEENQGSEQTEDSVESSQTTGSDEEGDTAEAAETEEEGDTDETVGTDENEDTDPLGNLLEDVENDDTDSASPR